MQERRKSIANALELRLSCSNPSEWWLLDTICCQHFVCCNFFCLYKEMCVCIYHSVVVEFHSYRNITFPFYSQYCCCWWPGNARNQVINWHGVKLVCAEYSIASREGLNTLKLRQNGCNFADDIFRLIFMYENCMILTKISLKCVPKGPINNNPALVQIMARHQTGNKPLSEPMMS